MSRDVDAVREARDSALGLAVAVAPVGALALLLGQATSDIAFWARWLLGPLLVALLVLTTLCFALLAADRLARRVLRVHAFPVGRGMLLVAALFLGVVLVVGLPATWPVLIGFGAACLVLAALVLLGAVLDL